MQFKEIEFKYRADNISLDAFIEFCTSRNPIKTVLASGYDHFYDSDNKGSFCRHRVGPDANQLTFKRKIEDKNNFVRTEHNIDLAKSVSKDQVAALCEEFGYQYNMSLFKSCFVYVYNYYILVFYVVYDSGMKEVGRFIEIEMAEDYDWINETEAFNELVAMEKLCKPLGLSVQSRVKKSLFELYRKEK